MLHEKYFDDAFILHDKTNIYPNLQRMLLFDGEEINEFSELMKSASVQTNDDRKILMEKWGSPKNFYKFQPLTLIRDYFGESFALYFGWLGVFNFTLIFPFLSRKRQ